MTGPKERIYDEQISPLVKQINEICKRESISVLSFFVLDFSEEQEAPLTCLTSLPQDEHWKAPFRRAIAELRPASTITTSVSVGGIMTVRKGPPRGPRED